MTMTPSAVLENVAVTDFEPFITTMSGFTVPVASPVHPVKV